jgi:U3 small nucleolar RNA-associated protein 7
MTSSEDKKYMRVGRDESIFTKKSLKAVPDLRAKKILRQDEKFAREAARHAAATELLLPHGSGFLEADGPMERTFKVRQDQLKEMVDLQSAKKIFDITLPATEGPFRARYTRNGRCVLLGGEQGGQLAGFDWQTGKLRFEMNLEAGEVVHDVTWLQNETFFAAAQKKYVYVYDHAGREVHRLKQHSTAEKLNFLPYHFLLTSTSRDGHLRYTDVSIGSLVADLPFYGTGACTSPIAVNPRSGIVNLGHANGTVTFWAPKMPAALVKILAHRGPVSAVAIDPTGQHMATAGVDGSLRVWDLRTYREALTTLNAGSRVSSLDFSQRGVLAVGHGPRVTIWKDLLTCEGAARVPYMNHLIPGQTITNVQFCPFEDVLGIGHSGGFSSIMIPGSGEANYDSFEANPFATVKQRREGEVRQLLEKLQPESIVIDPEFIGRVHRPAQIDIDADREVEAAANNKEKKEKNRAKGRNSSLKRYLRKRQNVIDERKTESCQKAAVQVIRDELGPIEKKSALSRFIRKID